MADNKKIPEFKKYPMQVVSAKRKNKALAFAASLSLTNEEPPLEMHAGYSVFKVSLVDTSGAKTIVPCANLHPFEIDNIRTKTKLALAYLFNNENQCVKNDVSDEGDDIHSGPAFTTRLVDKNFKGKTPAEVLIENPKNKESLIKIKDWLSQNVDRYPNNRKQIEAIEQAINLDAIGELTSVSESKPTKTCVGKEVVIYSSADGKSFKSKTNAKGYELCYKITITFNPAMNYPFEVKIMNVYAPIARDGNGMQNAKLSQGEDMIQSSIKLSADEWDSITAHLKRTVQNFEQSNFEQQYKKAVEIANANRNSATKDGN